MFAAYAIARLEFPGKRLLLSLALAIAMFRRRPLRVRCSTCGAISASTTPGWPDHPLPDIRPAAVDLDDVGVLPADPVEMEHAAQVDGATRGRRSAGDRPWRPRGCSPPRS